LTFVEFHAQRSSLDDLRGVTGRDDSLIQSYFVFSRFRGPKFPSFVAWTSSGPGFASN
jgi:hypothetical protein